MERRGGELEVENETPTSRHLSLNLEEKSELEKKFGSYVSFLRLP